VNVRKYGAAPRALIRSGELEPVATAAQAFNATWGVGPIGKVAGYIRARRHGDDGGAQPNNKDPHRAHVSPRSLDVN
jgi:hypothetical protein